MTITAHVDHAHTTRTYHLITCKLQTRIQVNVTHNNGHAYTTVTFANLKKILKLNYNNNMHINRRQSAKGKAETRLR